MGKKGAAMRAAKAQNTTYTFTRAQLDERDRALLLEYRQRVKKETDEYLAKRKKEMWKLIEEEWQKRTELLRAEDGTPGGFMTVLNLLNSVSCKILIEHFGWPPIRKGYSSRYRTVRFCELLVDEINRITSNDDMDIRKYNDDVFERYGIRFNTVGGEEEEQ